MGNNYVKQGNGYMFIQLSKPCYLPGETVEGTIYLRTMVPMEVDRIILQSKGYEKGSFYKTVHRDNETHVEHRHHSHTYFNQESPCFVFSVSILNPGDYAIPFSFPLPQGITSSIQFCDRTRFEKPEMKIKYFVKAYLKNKKSDNLMKYKQIVQVREPVIQQQQHINKVCERQLTTCCCINQGTSKLDVFFEKNVFYPNENCRAQVTLDNSKCTLRMNQVRFVVEQHISIHAGWDTYSTIYNLSTKNETGLEARHSKPEIKQFDLPLSTIKYDVGQDKKKDGTFKMRSDEAMFFLSQLQPQVNSKHLKNEYFLGVRCDFEGCTCCSQQPNVLIPITILSQMDLQQFQIQSPPDFNPVYYDKYFMLFDPSAIQINQPQV
eukprot:403376073